MAAVRTPKRQPVKLSNAYLARANFARANVSKKDESHHGSTDVTMFGSTDAAFQTHIY